MFKSKLFLQSIFIIISIVSLYIFSISSFVLPKINSTVETLEEKNAKEVLNKIKTLALNTNAELESYHKQILQKYKDELRHLTDTAWSIIQTKYENSKTENIGNLLKKRSNEFEKNFMSFYNKNKNTMSETELKEALKNYIKIYRYDNSIGYFWINDFEPKMILHPIMNNLNGKYLGDYKDSDGVYLFNEMVHLCKTKDKGIVKYKWLNPKSKKVEDKISYVFNFKPFNWIIGTGEYVNLLKERLQNEVFELIKTLRYGGDNYFFIYDYNNIAISHPHIQGKDMSDVKDKKGNLIVPPFVKIAKEKGEGFTKYWWHKNSIDGKSYEKLTYVKNFPLWDMVIATGIFIDDIDKEVAKRKQQLVKQLSKIIDTTKIGENGYLYIFDGTGNMIIHPNKKTEGKKFKYVKNPKTKNLMFEDLKKASKTKSKMLNYKWNMLSDKENYTYDKISWVEYIPELDWYICSSVYTDEFNKTSNQINKFIMLITIIGLIIFAILIIIFLKKILKPILELSTLTSKIANGDYNVRANIDQNDELGALAKSFNCMVDTTKDLIENLDTKIYEKTLDLDKANKEIQETNKKVRDSINHASLIQNALLPDDKILSKYFKDYFVTWTPKDTVGGDIWLFNELRHKDECLLFYIDCTGHGVPGAFVTMIVKAVEREVILKIKTAKFQDIDVSPAWIMQYFNKTIKQLLKQEKKDSLSNVGWDGGIIYYNRRTQILKFAGAQTSLYYVDENSDLKTIKGDHYSVGYKNCDSNYEYKDTIISTKEGMKFFCTTDGYLDQNGGEKDFPFGKKRFENIIKSNHHKPMKELHSIFNEQIYKYEAMIPNNDRNDDITIISFEIGVKSNYIEKYKEDIVKYTGIITQNAIGAFIDNINLKITNRTLLGRVSAITIEYCQNMMQHSKNTDINSKQIVPAGEIYVTDLNGEYYEIMAINIVSTNDMHILEPVLLIIQSLDAKDIKEKHKELRRANQGNNDNKYIGLYEIAKFSDSIEYKFKQINEDKYFFTIKSIINNRHK